MELEYVDFGRYLLAKKTVDDRALNRGVWGALKEALPLGELRVLEIGAGVGTMIERGLAWGLFEGRRVDYYAIDSEVGNLGVMEGRLAAIEGELGEAGVVVSAETLNLFDLFSRPAEQGQYDLIIAHAFLDLIDVPTHLDSLFALLKPEGLLYTSINFDGITSLQPTVDAEFDLLLEREYHRIMDERITDGQPAGDSLAGRHLLQVLSERGYLILAAGSSDWVVFGQAGGYSADEAYFLHFIIDTMYAVLRDRPKIDPTRLADWRTTRHDQIKQGKLIYIAHQLDILTRNP